MVARRTKRLWWIITRAFFRWIRILLLVLVLFVVAAGTYLNSVGLPDFLKRPLLGKLREQGWDVQFKRMRWGWYRGLVIENATFTRTDQTNSAMFFAGETELNVDMAALTDSELKLNAITIRGGEVSLPLDPDHEPLTASDINGKVRFKAGDQMVLDHLNTRFQGWALQLSGTLTNVSALQDIKPPKSSGTDAKSRIRLAQVLAELEKIEFSEPPLLTLNFGGDARDLQNLHADLALVVAAAQTPWGKFEEMKAKIHLNEASSTEEAQQIKLQISSVRAHTPWASGEDFSGEVVLHGFEDSNLVKSDVQISVNRFHADWLWQSKTNFVRAVSAQFFGRTTQQRTNFMPVLAEGRLRLLQANVALHHSTNAFTANLPETELTVSYDAARTNGTRLADDSWAAWSKLEPFVFSWNTTLKDIKAAGLKIEKASSIGQWKAPLLTVESVEAQLYRGSLKASGGLNVASRKATVKGDSSFDVQQITPLLNRGAQRFVQKFGWENKPPRLSGQVSAVLPAWTNSAPNWREDVLPSLTIDASASVENGSYRKIAALRASTDLHYSNMVWRIPSIHVVRPEGELRLALVSDDRTRDFHWNINGAIDPRAARHELGEGAQKVFENLQLTGPPMIRGDLWGRWNDHQRLGFLGEITATNLSYRGAAADILTLDASYTNLFMKLSNIKLRHGPTHIDAESIAMDFHTNRIFFNNIGGTGDPMVITRAIGRKVAAAIEPYRYLQHPTVTVNGALTVNRIDDADMHFTVTGNDFRWELFQADTGSAEIHWVGQSLVITNARASAYKGGHLSGAASFDFTPKQKAGYQFKVNFADIDVQSLVNSIGNTNSIEGLLNGDLTVTEADTRGLQTWQGFGRMHVKDGVIWEIPVFGIFSPVLDTIAPGVGKSKAREATATFLITNGVAYSDDLEIRASTMRMQYRGSVDYQYRLDARVEAEILRDTWGIGRVVSLALSPLTKVFEYKVSGTISDPKMEPLYIPKFLMAPLRPFHTIKNLFPDGSEAQQK